MSGLTGAASYLSGTSAALAGGGAASGGFMSALGGPLGIGLAVAQGVLGFGQAQAARAARDQDYVNQVAFQNATSAFNKWQASYNAQITNLNNQHTFWAKTVAYNSNRSYVHQLRNYEIKREIAQADRVAETRTSAGLGYITNAAAIQDALQERGMQEAVAVQQYKYRALQQSAAFRARMQEGKSSDRYVADYDRQASDYATLARVSEGLRNRQYRRDQMANVVRYLSEYNSQTFYEKAPHQEPLAPFAPLPTMVMPPPPSFTGGRGSDNSVLDAVTAVTNGIGTAVNIGSSIG